MAKNNLLPARGQRTWENVPHTDRFAVVKSERSVKNVAAIRVEKARHRLATVSGWFEVSDIANPFVYERGSLVVQVNCLWYGLRPEGGKEWMKLRITNDYQLERRYTGKVAADIER